MIPESILIKHNASLKQFNKNDIIFNELQVSSNYYQICSGSVKMYNISEDGKEFTQGIFKSGNSFGEPPLFGGFPYPAAAISLESTSIYVLKKSAFFNLLEDNPLVHQQFTTMLCKRLYYKATLMKEISIYPPEHRILTLLNHLKSEKKLKELYEVKLTRQEISEMTGLRVETVIRAIKKLETQNKLFIKERKVYL